MAMKVLNNLVSELLSVPNVPSGREFRFTNPRKGWVFVSCAAEEGHEALRLVLDGAEVTHRAGARTVEAMRVLAAGEHTLRINTRRRRAVSDLLVRTVPELAYCKFQYDPHIPEYGPYDWAFLQKHILPHVNTVVGSGSPEHQPLIAWWKERGGKWLIEGPLPGMSAPSIAADEVYDAWAANPGFADPLTDGLLADEFFAGSNPKYPAWMEAMKRLAANERFRGKCLYPYLGSHWPDKNDWHEGAGDKGPESSRQFFQAVLDAGFPIAWERYLQERHEQHVAAEYLQSRLGDTMKHWLTVFPGCAKQLLVCLGYMTITESLNIHPSVDYKVFMDMQFRYLATQPEFAGLFGILEYTSGYADEETVRWAARLYRHYGIEGDRDLLSDRLGYTYRLAHITNSDFAEGLEGWTVPIRIEKNVAVRSMEGFSHLQGRWPGTSVGNTFFWMRRSDERPNAISQPMRNLKPGRLYSAKMISGDYGDLVAGRSQRQKHCLSLAVEGADVLPEKTFQSVIPNNYAHQFGPFKGDHKFWFNYHQVLFRAKSENAQLSISDWANDKEPGGPVGQELMCNFVEVQPYWDGEE